MKEVKMVEDDALFQMDGSPSLGQIAPLGIQHVLAAFVGVITPALIVGEAAGLSQADISMLIQLSLVITALASLIQLYPIKGIGSGLPAIMGVSFAYVPTLIAIGGQYGIDAIFGAQIIGGLVSFFFGLYVKKLRKFFPPIITGTVIFTIGLSLYGVAIRYMAGGAGSPDFGSVENWLVAMVTLGIVVYLTHFTKGLSKLSATLIAIVTGYILAFSMGMISFEGLGDASWFQFTKPLYFGIEFRLSAIISLAIMYIVNSVQAIGDFTSITVGGLGRQPSDEELRGGIMGSGLSSSLGSFLGGLPIATYSQNVGILTVNKVVNKRVFLFASLVFLVSGFIPKLASILTTIPHPVIGGATLPVFAQIAMTGIRMITSEEMTGRNVAVVGLSVALGVGITSVPGALDGFPVWLGSIFGSSSVVISTLTAIFLNQVLPRENKDTNTDNNKDRS